MSFDNTMFESEEFGSGDDNVLDDAEDYSSPSGTILFPSLDIEQELDEISQRFQTLKNRDDHVKLKDRLVDAFYNALEHAFGLQLRSIDYDQFELDDDGKTLYWKPNGARIRLSTKRGRYSFLSLETLRTEYGKLYGKGGTDAIRISLGLTDYKSGISWLSSCALETLQNAEETLPKKH